MSIFTILAIWSAYQAKLHAASTGALLATAICGLLAVGASCAVYATTSMPQWSLFEQYPYLAFFASTFLLGPSLVFLLRTNETVIVAVLIAIGGLFLLQSASYVPPSSFSLIRFFIAGFGIVGMLFVICKKYEKLAPVALLLLVLGEGMGRYIFFAD